MKMSQAESRSLHVLPTLPEPLEVELEFTNVCNAHCTACPRGDMPGYGSMTRETLDRILDAYLAARPSYQINRLLGRDEFPKVTIAGGGEPLIHREAVPLIRRIVAKGFKAHLITNASRLTPDLTESLVTSGLGSVCVSFWGVRREEYEAAMRLPYDKTLRNVEALAEAARRAGLPMCVLWVRAPEVTSSDEEIAAFWAERGIEVEMTDNHMWNRGGLTPLPKGRVAGGALQLPDVSRRVWCADLFFSDTYNWEGQSLLCCCNYFTSKPYRLGDIRSHSPADISRVKAGILGAQPIPAMCQVCEQPRRNQSKWMAGPWLEHISPEEACMATYDPAWTPDTA
jgi:hypothetical protein